MLFERSHQIVKSYAKINLSLKVLNKREDGYHNLETVMIPVELHDVIEIEKRPGAFDTFITTLLKLRSVQALLIHSSLVMTSV